MKKGERGRQPGMAVAPAMPVPAAAGGSHLELEKRVRNYYSFMVAYENFLRGPGLSEVPAKTWVGGERTSEDARLGEERKRILEK